MEKYGRPGKCRYSLELQQKSNTSSTDGKQHSFLFITFETRGKIKDGLPHSICITFDNILIFFSNFSTTHPSGKAVDSKGPNVFSIRTIAFFRHSSSRTKFIKDSSNPTQSSWTVVRHLSQFSGSPRLILLLYKSYSSFGT